jgi:microcystin-dependent protein
MSTLHISNDLKNLIADTIYPIGSIYISVNSTNPGTLFGGTWTQLEDRFLIGAGSSYNAGGTGGTSSVTLSTSNLPKHTHGVNIKTSGGGHNHNQYFMEVRWASNYNGTKSLGRPQSVGSGNTNERATTSDGSHSHTVSGNTGDGGFSNSAFSIIPPYLAVYMWKRTG